MKNNRFYRNPLTAITLTALTLTSQQLFAQGTLEEVIVTAQKREQKLQDVPIALQAFSSSMMESVNIRDFSEVINLVPGANESRSNTLTQRHYALRGIVQAGAEPDGTVGYYVNESAFFVFGQANAPISRTYDLERVEVLRGPQSTLYGNSSMGGVVRFITKKPNLENFEAHLQGGYSDTDGGESGDFVDAAVSIPLIENQLGIRLVGSYQDIGGFQFDAFGNENVNPAEITSLRAEALWHANDSLSFDLLHLQDNGDALGGTLQSSLDPPIGNSTPGSFNNNEQKITALTMNWDLNFAALTANITAIDATTDALFNVIFPGLGLPDDILKVGSTKDGEALNSEWRLVSQGDSDLQWLAGIFYADSKNTDANVFSALLPSGTSNHKSKAISVFGEISYSLLDGKLIPLVGLRYFEDERNVVLSGSVTQAPKTTFDALSPRFNLQWLPNDNTNYYLNIVKGFRSGSFNNRDVCDLIAKPPELGGFGFPCEVAIDSDELWSYEVGGKWTLADGQLQVDVSAYYMDWKDNRQPIFPAPGFSSDFTVGDAKYTGIDLGVIYAPAAIEGLVLQASANVNKNEFQNLEPTLAAIAGARNGDPIPLAPEYTIALLARYSRALTGDWMGHASMNISHLAGPAGQYGQSLDADDRTLLRARIGVSFQRFGVYLFGTNLLKEDGAIFAQDIGGSVNVTQDYPQTVGLELTFNYD